MRICVNTRLLLPGKLEGIGRFTKETLKLLTELHPEHEFIFIFDRKYSEEFIFNSNVKPVVAFPQARHPVLWYLFFEWGVPPVLRKYTPDVFLSPDGWLSLRTRVPSIPVIHDLNFYHNPGWVSPLPRYYYYRYFPKFIQKATRIATVSEFSRQDISSRFKVPASQIDVVYNGIHDTHRPLGNEDISATRKRYADGAPYFLFLSLVHPRKNLTRIIGAYNRFRDTNQANIPLLIVGATKYMTEDTRSAHHNSPYRDQIKFLGRLPGEELRMILGSGLALVYASLFEGFGIPILEAMQSCIPVITSDTTSMPEVGGNAVCYVDPYNEESIAEAMARIYHDENYREHLVRAGVDQLNKFSWKKTAELLWDSVLRGVNPE